MSGRPDATAAITAAPSTLTPMKPATPAPPPHRMVSASLVRHGRMTCSSERSVSPQPSCAASSDSARTSGPAAAAGAAVGAAAAGRAPPVPSCGDIRRR